jgi:hypothetical protein
MKKKANGDYRARLAAIGFQQIDGHNYDESSKAAPVANEITVRIILIMIVMAAWTAEIVDVRGVFLHREFLPGEEVYMEVPQGFQKFYKGDVVLFLLQTLYGVKQAALAFWRELLQAMWHMEFKRSKADPCLYWKWTKAYGL